jgi:hypothetical protein
MPTFPMVCRFCARPFAAPIQLLRPDEPATGGCPRCGRAGEIVPGGYQIDGDGNFHFFQRIEEVLHNAKLTSDDLQNLAILAQGAQTDASKGEELRKALCENPQLRPLANMLPNPESGWGGFTMVLCTIISMLLTVRQELREARMERNAAKRKRRARKTTGPKRRR